MIAFGLVSMLVTGLVSVLTWNLCSSYMLDQRQTGAVRQARVDARLVESRLHRESNDIPELLTGLGSKVESAVLLVDRGQWISSGNLIDPRQLPRSLLAMVEAGQAARQRVRLHGVPVLAVGLPVAAAAATYVEVVPLSDLDRSLRFLSWLLCGGVLASGLGGALLGRWAAGRALRPLRRLTDAAAGAAAGDLSVRLPETYDPDLAALASAFNDTAERLQQRVMLDSRFAADVSHELRSPITTMINAMAVLRRRRPELTTSAQQALDLLDTELSRFQRLVEDLLEISRPPEQDVPNDLELVDLSELVIRSVEDGNRPYWPVVTTTEPHPRVLADRRRLERALVNLVANAEQHGGGLVRLAVRRRGNNARIEVDDAGPGIPVRDRARIFERFSRGSPRARQADDGGTGLGLALVAQHVRHHGGTAWVEDRPGGGARFVIELPADADHTTR